VLSKAAVVTENGLPILWEKAPSELAQLPTVDGVIQINPWDYLQRMALFKLLIKSTDPYMSSMGPGEKENPLWSLPLQLGWKLKSGMKTRNIVKVAVMVMGWRISLALKSITLWVCELKNM